MASRVIEEDSEFIFLEISDVEDVYTRYPETVLSGLTKIGGLIALIKALTLFSLLHKHRFEKHLAGSHSSRDATDFT
jgi:hypothetical protein